MRHHRLHRGVHRGVSNRARDDRRDGKPQRFDPADQVAPQPLRHPLWQRRDDDLVKAPVTDSGLNRLERLRPADEPLDRTSGGSFQERHRALKRPVGRVAVAHVRHEQRKLTRTGPSATPHRLQQTRRGRRPVGNHKNPDAPLGPDRRLPTPRFSGLASVHNPRSAGAPQHCARTPGHWPSSPSADETASAYETRSKWGAGRSPRGAGTAFRGSGPTCRRSSAPAGGRAAAPTA
jgi:hypothetical protein